MNEPAPGVVCQWFVHISLWGETSASAPEPRVRLLPNIFETEADGGVGRGHCAEEPGAPPYL